jgi:hypothetical protein
MNPEAGLLSGFLLEYGTRFGDPNNFLFKASLSRLFCPWLFIMGCVIVLPSVVDSADVVDVTPLETIWLFENVFFGVES